MKAMTFRFDDEFAQIIDADAKTAGSATAAVMQLFADGLRLRMQQKAPAVHPHFTENLTVAGVVQLYRQFIEAVQARAGLIEKPRYRFAQVPGGGRWEAKGLAGAWGVLHTSEQFTVNGIEHSVVTDEEPIL